MKNSVIYLDNLKCSYYKGATESKNKLYAQAKEDYRSIQGRGDV